MDCHEVTTFLQNLEKLLQFTATAQSQYLNKIWTSSSGAAEDSSPCAHDTAFGCTVSHSIFYDY